MQMCANHTTCPFFNSDVGYSPELNDAMKERFCRANNARCARKIAIKAIGRDAVPADMLPTDFDRLSALLPA